MYAGLEKSIVELAEQIGRLEGKEAEKALPIREQLRAGLPLDADLAALRSWAVNLAQSVLSLKRSQREAASNLASLTVPQYWLLLPFKAVSAMGPEVESDLPVVWNEKISMALGEDKTVKPVRGNGSAKESGG